MDADKARRMKRSIDMKPVIVAKKDAWYKHPGYHSHLSEGASGLCTHCGLQESVHRKENECYEEWLMRVGRAAR